MKNEKLHKPSSGYLMILVVFALLGGISAAAILFNIKPLMIANLIPLFLAMGFTIVPPNHSKVMTLFGKYVGSIKADGFFWVNPFYLRKGYSLRANNMEQAPIKVNDKMGNPVMIGAVLVWRVKDTFKAAFEVDRYEHFVKVQSESAVRQLATAFPYDKFDDEEAEISLRDGGEEVNHLLEDMLQKRLEMAGIEVIEARISYLAYASEIAGAMLQRQQATAVVAARKKIVEGAVGMVEMALEALSSKKIVELDDDKKAAMVSNLMVVLCSERSVAPVVNTGTLHQ
jgi:regulator of protease activity HflC (stomatin/prohibitin superfamily)